MMLCIVENSPTLLKRSNIDKEKGISPVSVFRVLVTLAFTGKNLFRTLEAGGSCGMAKDTVYRFLNSIHTNWRRFLLLLSSLVISQELEPLTVTAKMKVLIADYTLYRRNRNKYVELLSPMPPWCAADTSCWPSPSFPDFSYTLVGFLLNFFRIIVYGRL